ncbi:hypothetical protein ACFE04_020859 [Oxalis oulophora]
MEVNSQTSLTYLKKSTKVEVSKPKADIFKRAYFTATIIDTPPWPTRNRNSNEYLVQYDNLLSTDGAKYLIEFVDLSLIRPLPPSRAYNPFELNDVVDVYHLHGWRVCVVDMVMCNEEGKEYRVRFDQNPSSHYMDVAHDFLRPHFDWVGGKWVPLKIPKKERYDFLHSLPSVVEGSGETPAAHEDQSSVLGEVPAAHEDQSSVLGEVPAAHEDIDLLRERYYLEDTCCNNSSRWSNEKKEEEEIYDEGQ